MMVSWIANTVKTSYGLVMDFGVLDGDGELAL